MSVFRDWLQEEYHRAPADMGRFAAKTCRVVRVSRRWWRGQRVMRELDVEVRHEGHEVRKEAHTPPRWRLLPASVKATFSAHERAVDAIISAYCQSPAADDRAIVLGGGTYVLASGNWPHVRKLLQRAQEVWSETADEYCTVDGYNRFCQEIQEQVGEADWETVEKLVPDRHTLRTKFSLDVDPLPIRLVPEPSDEPGDADAVRDAALELIETAVRQPRVRLAEACEDLVDRLSVVDAAGVRQARQNTRKSAKTQLEVAAPRTIRKETILGLRAVVDEMAAFRQFQDERLARELEYVRILLPDTSDVATKTADVLNRTDAEAVRLSTTLAALAAAARDETGMCAGLQTARGKGATT